MPTRPAPTMTDDDDDDDDAAAVADADDDDDDDEDAAPPKRSGLAGLAAAAKASRVEEGIKLVFDADGQHVETRLVLDGKTVRMDSLETHASPEAAKKAHDRLKKALDRRRLQGSVRVPDGGDRGRRHGRGPGRLGALPAQAARRRVLVQLPGVAATRASGSISARASTCARTSATSSRPRGSGSRSPPRWRRAASSAAARATARRRRSCSRTSGRSTRTRPGWWMSEKLDGDPRVLGRRRVRVAARQPVRRAAVVRRAPAREHARRRAVGRPQDVPEDHEHRAQRRGRRRVEAAALRRVRRARLRRAVRGPHEVLPRPARRWAAARARGTTTSAATGSITCGRSSRGSRRSAARA